MKKIIITGRAHPLLAERFRQLGYVVIDDPEISYDELLATIDDVIGIVVTTRLPIDRQLIDKATSLQWIGRLGSGMELIDVEYAIAKGIRCESSPEGNRRAVGEHTLGMLLALLNNIVTSSQQVRDGIWEREANRGTELGGKTIGIIGYGQMGTAFAELLAPFDVTILAYDKYKYGFGGEQVREASFEQVCQYADVISFHVPLTNETLHMAGEPFFHALRKKPWILNTSRGKVLSIPALLDALQEDRISGAGLDVLENEKPSTYTEAEKKDLLALSNDKRVIITPHIAGYSFQAFRKMAEILLVKLGY